MRISPEGLCVLCPDPNCVSCEFNTPSDCVNCVNSLYEILANGTCFAAACTIENCVTCGGQIEAVICDACTSGYTAYEGKCFLCNDVPNCQSCSGNNICAVCNEGYSPHLGECITCPISNCIQCTTSEQCQ